MGLDRIVKVSSPLGTLTLVVCLPDVKVIADVSRFVEGSASIEEISYMVFNFAGA
jgi:hypothetical protein